MLNQRVRERNRTGLIAEIVVKLGIADTESALDVLITIRENAKDDQDIKDDFWGKLHFKRNSLLCTLSWTLFNLAEQVDSCVIAQRFLGEFRELIQLADSGLNPSDPGKSPQQLLYRLLCQSRNSSIFSLPAFEFASKSLLFEDCWPFVGELSKCILEPKRERSQWVANWTLGISTYVISTGLQEWKHLVSLRTRLFESLEPKRENSLYDRVWPLLSNSHHALSYVTIHYPLNESDRSEYRKVLIDDLKKCQSLLKRPCALGEATLARSMWEWYIKYGKDEYLVALARECERIYSALSKWRIQDFFSFDFDEELTVEVSRIAGSLRSAKATP